MLNCPAKRISKKFVGTNYNGKQIYTKMEDGDVDTATLRKHHTKLKELELDFIRSIKPFFEFQEITAKRERDLSTGRVLVQKEKPQSKVGPSDRACVTSLASTKGSKPSMFDLLSNTKTPEASAAEDFLQSTRTMSMNSLIHTRLSSQGMRIRAPTTRHLTMNTPPIGSSSDDAMLRALLHERPKSSMGFSHFLSNHLPSTSGESSARMRMGSLKRKVERQSVAALAKRLRAGVESSVSPSESSAL